MMSSMKDFNDDDNSFGDNNTPHQVPHAQWFQNYNALGQPVGLSVSNFNNHFDVSRNPSFNSNDSFLGNLNTTAFNHFNPYAALRLAQLPHPHLGHVNNLSFPLGQTSQIEYYATPSFGLPYGGGVAPQLASPFIHPQQSVIPSTESWEVAPTTPAATTVRLETISPDVLRGQYTRPVESGFQPFLDQNANYDSSYRHFELDEHEHELSVPPQPQDVVRGQTSQSPPSHGEGDAFITEGCFAQCGDKDNEDLIGCRNGSCVAAFHPECVKLGAREDGLPACPSCLSMVDTALLGLINDTASLYSPPPDSRSVSVRITQSPARITPAPSIGSSFHPSPSPAARRTPQKRAIKIESSSPPAPTELFGSYKGSIAVPEGFASARGLNNKGAWTAEEDAACIQVMRNLLAIHNGSRRIAIDTLWQRASEALKEEGIERSSSGIKMQWTRRLRAQSGVDERAVPRPDLLCTGLLKKGAPRRLRVAEPTPPPATPTTRRSTKKSRGLAAETSLPATGTNTRDNGVVSTTHVKNSRIVKLKIGTGTAAVTGSRRGRGRGPPRKSKVKAQKKIEHFEDDVSPITEDPDEGISMYGRGTPGLQQEMEIDLDDLAYDASPSSSAFEDALEDTLMDRGYVMEE